jgi:type I restriction enzyme S subunit
MNLKKGLMQKLLVKGIGHTKFKDSPLGEIPEEWEVVKQVSVATFYNGRAYKLTEWETTGTPVIRLQNLTGTGENYYYSNLKLPKHQYCYHGDLLYMWSATFGATWWKGDKAIFHYHIWKIEVEPKKLIKEFHYYLLDDITTRMKNQSNGSTMLHVTKGGMKELLVQLPPLPEQRKIADILSSADAKLESLRTKKEEYTKLKKGLMEKLLTGKIRVKV